MNTIENKAVKLTLQNEQFEAAAAKTEATIARLESSMDADKMTKGFTAMTAAAGKVDLSPIDKGIQTVTRSFSALEVMGITALANITNSAINAGKNLLKSFTIDPISTGLTEYETKLNAIQTILTNTASKGTTMSEVTDTLDELNEYADKTIYNFAQMTRNIGTFTAAGQGLETSATAIKGIANLAAGVGASADDASRAMYQMSQALGTGYLMLMDYNSLVNAGMGGELFKTAAIEAGIAAGAIREGQVTAENFRNTLESGWLTSDILVGVFESFANDPALVAAATQVKTLTQLIDTLRESVQSGWAQSFELIIGNFDQAKILWTSVSDTIGGYIQTSSDARNATLEGWAAMGGRDALVNGLVAAFEAFRRVLEPIGDAWESVFPPITSQRLYAMTVAFGDFFRTIQISETTMDQLMRTFQGIFAAVDLFTTAVMAPTIFVFEVFEALISRFDSTLLGSVAVIGDVVYSFNEWFNLNDRIVYTAGLTADAITNIINHVIAWYEYMMTLPEVQSILASLNDVLVSFGSGLWEGFSNAGIFIGEFIDKIREMDSIDPSSILGLIVDFVTGLLGAFSGVIPALSSIGTFLTKFVSGFLSIFDHFGFDLSAVIGNVTSVLTGFGEFILGLSFFDVVALLQVAAVLAILVAIVKTLFTAVTGVVNVFGLFNNITNAINDIADGFKASATGDSILKMAASIGILVASLYAISMIEDDKLAKSAIALASVIATLVLLLGISAAANKLDAGDTLLRLSLLILAIGAGVIMISSAIDTLSGVTIDSDAVIAIATSIVLIAATVATLTIASKYLEKVTIGLGVVIVAIAWSITLMVDAMNELSQLQLDSSFSSKIGVLALALAGLAGLLAASTKLTQHKQSILAVALVMASVYVFVLGLEKLAAVDFDALQDKLGGIIAVLGVIAGLFLASRLAGQYAKDAGVMIIGISAGVLILSLALKNLGNLTKSEIELASVSLIALGIFMASMIAVSGLTGQFAAKAAPMLLALGVATILMSVAMYNLSNLNPDMVAPAIACIAAIGIVMSAILALSSISKSAFGTLTGISLVFLSLSLVIGSASNTTPEQLNALSLLIITLGALLVAMFGLSGPATLALPALALAGLTIAACVLLLHAIDDVDSNKALPNVLALGVLIGEFIVLSYALAGLGPLSSLAVAGGVAMLGVILVSAILVSAAAALNQAVPGIQEFMNGGIQLLTQFGEGIGGFIGGIVASINTQVVNSLPNMGTQLSAFATNVEGFVTGIKMVDQQSIDGFANFATLYSKLAEMIVLDSSLNSGIDTVGAMALNSFMSSFATGIQDFAAKTANIQPNTFNTIAQATTRIASAFSVVSNSPINEGTAQAFVDTLATIGPAVAAFGANVSGLDAGVVSAASDAISVIAELNQKLPTSGGVWEWFTGSQDMTKFAGDLSSLGTALGGFVRSAGNVNESSVSGAIQASNLFIDLATRLPTAGGFFDVFLGNQTLDDFGRRLVILGEGLAGFVEEAGAISPEDVSSGIAAADLFVTLANALPNTGGFTGILFGDNSLSGFGANIGALAIGLVTFTDTTSKITESDIAHTTSIMGMLDLIANTTSGGAWNGMAVYAASVTDLAVAISLVNAYLAEVDVERLNFMGTVGSAISASGSIIESSIKTVLVTSGENMQNNAEIEDAFVSIGRNLILGVSGGMDAERDTVANSGVQMITDLAKAMRLKAGINSKARWFMDQVGQWIPAGVASGILNGEETITNAGTQLMDDLMTAMTEDFTTEGLSIGSYDAGVGVSTGLATGIANTTTPEEEAQAKIDAVIAIFEEGFAAIDLDMTTIDLTAELATKAVGISDYDKTVIELGAAQEKIVEQEKAIELAQAEIDALLAEGLDSSSELYQEKTNALLQEQIELQDLYLQIEESMSTLETLDADSRAAAEEASAARLQAKLANDEAYLAAAKESAQNPNLLGIFDNDVEAMTQYLYDKHGFDPNFEENNPDVVSNLEGVGAAYQEAIGEGMTSAAPETVTKAVIENAQTIMDQAPLWTNAGEVLVDALINGMASKLTALEEMGYIVAMTATLGGVTSNGSGGGLTSVGNATYVNRSSTSSDLNISADRAAVDNLSSTVTNTHVSGSTTEITYNFNQTNTSPKSLSTGDIYRQTGNLFSTLKNEVL